MNVKRVIKELIRKGYTMSKEGIVHNPSGRRVSGCETSNGYIKIGVRVLEYKSYTLRVHKFQGYLKFGDKCFEKRMDIRHLNGNPKDNSWENIGIGTRSENMMDMPKEKRILNASNLQHSHQDIIDDHNRGLSYRELMEKYNITSKGTISFIINKSLASVA